jgi:hypothetical protein
MVLGTVDVFDARDPAIDTAPALAVEAEHAVEACIAARRGLDTALALLGYVHALSTVRTVHAGVASPAASKNALIDRRAHEAVASRLDANRTDGTIIVRIAEAPRWTGITESARDAISDARTGVTNPRKTTEVA